MSLDNDVINFTCIPNKIIDEHLRTAKPEYIVVCLYMFRRLGEKGSKRDITAEEAAKALSLDVRTVSDALAYFAENGFLFKAAGGNIRLESRPTYSTAEIEKFALESEEIRLLFKTAERLFGKALTYSDMNLLVSFYDWLALPVPVIEVMLDYCASNRKKSSRYLEKVATDWADNGITSVELAEEYIKTFNTEYREILKAMGHTRREPAPKEIAYMRKWLKELGLPLNLVLEACGKTILQTGGTNFTYADKILSNWHEKGITTMEQVAEHEQGFRESKAATPAPNETRTRSASRQKSRFANSNKREWDYNELMKLATDYANKKATGE